MTRVTAELACRGTNVPPSALSDRTTKRFRLIDLELVNLQPTLSGTDPEPEELARAALTAGDHKQVITILMRTHGEAVFAYCREMIRDEDVLDDLLQTIFVQAYDGLPRFQRRSTFKTWLFGIARHRCLDELKGLRRRAKRWLPWSSQRRESAAPPAPDDDDTRTRESALEDCLAGLSPELRDLVIQRFRHALSYEEIAGLTARTPGALRVRLYRALSALRGCLVKKGCAP
jgi:RNA polymerase sigma-70 factor (ECF subfamily)